MSSCRWPHKKPVKRCSPYHHDTVGEHAQSVSESVGRCGRGECSSSSICLISNFHRDPLNMTSFKPKVTDNHSCSAWSTSKFVSQLYGLASLESFYHHRSERIQQRQTSRKSQRVHTRLEQASSHRSTATNMNAQRRAPCTLLGKRDQEHCHQIHVNKNDDSEHGNPSSPDCQQPPARNLAHKVSGNLPRRMPQLRQILLQIIAMSSFAVCYGAACYRSAGTACPATLSNLKFVPTAPLVLTLTWDAAPPSESVTSYTVRVCVCVYMFLNSLYLYQPLECHPTPCTLHPAPYNAIPFTLHPTPYTLPPTPSSALLNPKHQVMYLNEWYELVTFDAMLQNAFSFTPDGVTSSSGGVCMYVRAFVRACVHACVSLFIYIYIHDPTLPRRVLGS